MTSHGPLKLPFPSSGEMDVVRRFWIVDMNPWVLDIVKVGNLPCTINKTSWNIILRMKFDPPYMAS